MTLVAAEELADLREQRFELLLLGRVVERLDRGGQGAEDVDVVVGKLMAARGRLGVAACHLGLAQEHQRNQQRRAAGALRRR